MQPINTTIYGICGRRRGATELFKIVLSEDGVNSMMAIKDIVNYGTDFFTGFSHPAGSYIIKYDENLEVTAYQLMNPTTLYQVFALNTFGSSIIHAGEGTTDEIRHGHGRSINPTDLSDNSEPPYLSFSPVSGIATRIRDISVDASENMQVIGLRTGISGSVANYARYNSSGVIQHTAQILNSSNYANWVNSCSDGSVRYVCGISLSTNYRGIVTLGSTTSDAIVRVSMLYFNATGDDVYNLSIIHDPVTSAIYVGGLAVISGVRVAIVSKLSEDLLTLAWTKYYKTESSTEELLDQGIQIIDGVIYAAGYYVVAGVYYASIIKINTTDGTVIDTLSISENTNGYAKFRGLNVYGGNLYASMMARPTDSARNDGGILKINTTDFSELNGISTTGSEFTFSQVSTVATNLPDYGYNPSTGITSNNSLTNLTASGISDGYSASTLTTTEYKK